jgi:hypothetical protein
MTATGLRHAPGKRFDVDFALVLGIGGLSLDAIELQKHVDSHDGALLLIMM